MSAPACSATRAISFMKLMRVASIALAAYFASSAERRSITSHWRAGSRMKGRSSASSAIASASVAPTTMRSGARLSRTAEPSRRNSGLTATAIRCVAPRRASASRTTASTRSAVPAGKVDLQTSRPSRSRWCPTARATSNTASRSTTPSASAGALTTMKRMSPCRAASPASSVKRSRPAAVSCATSAPSPGSCSGMRPARRPAMRGASVSAHSTACPASAMQAAKLRPT